MINKDTSDFKLMFQSWQMLARIGTLSEVVGTKSGTI
jgi:hypothetical protein